MAQLQREPMRNSVFFPALLVRPFDSVLDGSAVGVFVIPLPFGSLGIGLGNTACLTRRHRCLSILPALGISFTFSIDGIEDESRGRQQQKWANNLLGPRAQWNKTSVPAPLIL